MEPGTRIEDPEPDLGGKDPDPDLGANDPDLRAMYPDPDWDLGNGYLVLKEPVTLGSGSPIPSR